MASPALILAADVAPLVSVCVSGLASTYVMHRLCRLSPLHRRRLLVRQLWNLALADLVYCVFTTLELALEISVFQGVRFRNLSLSTKNNLCAGLLWAYAVGAEAAILFECHLALTFLASIFARVRMLRVLSTGLLVTWPLAFLLAALEAMESQNRWAGVDRPYACVGVKKDNVLIVMVCICVLVALACYVLSSIRVQTAGEAVQIAVWRRARSFLLVVLVTMGPTMVYMLDVQVTLRLSPVWSNLMFLVASSLFNLSGLFNFVVYALQSRYAGHIRGASAPEPMRECENSFRVNFKPGDSVLSLEIESSIESSENLRPRSEHTEQAQERPRARTRVQTGYVDAARDLLTRSGEGSLDSLEEYFAGAWGECLPTS